MVKIFWNYTMLYLAMHPESWNVDRVQRVGFPRYSGKFQRSQKVNKKKSILIIYEVTGFFYVHIGNPSPLPTIAPSHWVWELKVLQGRVNSWHYRCGKFELCRCIEKYLTDVRHFKGNNWYWRKFNVSFHFVSVKMANYQLVYIMHL